jgi:hypothetical protein
MGSSELYGQCSDSYRQGSVEEDNSRLDPVRFIEEMGRKPTTTETC